MRESKPLADRNTTGNSKSQAPNSKQIPMTQFPTFKHRLLPVISFSHLDIGKRFFAKYGNKSVFFGRFIGPVRPIIPFVAGLSKMDRLPFFFWNIISAFLWATAYLLAGYFFGGAVKAIEVWSTRARVFLIFLFLILFLVWFVIKKSGRFFDVFKSILISIREAVAANPDIKRFVSQHPIFFGFIRHRINLKKFSGLSLTLLFIAFAYTLSLFFGVVRNVIVSNQIIASDKTFVKLYDYIYPVVICSVDTL